MPEKQLNTVKFMGYYKKQKVTVIGPNKYDGRASASWKLIINKSLTKP